MSVIEKREKRSHIWTREEFEHYVEPCWTSERLFDVETFDGCVWDPACGFGRIPEAAKRHGLDATGSDIVNRGYPYAHTSDFFHNTNACFNIVSNPPFDQFREFTEHALSLAHRKLALIWTVRTLPAARWLQETPLARIWFLTPRPSMPPGQVIARGEKPGGGKSDFCWLVWSKGHVGPPECGWLHRDGGSK